MKYTQTHEWIRLEGKIGTIGITDHAKSELGDIVHVELPKVGSIVKAGDEICVLESTKAAADIYSPVTGKILAVHEDLRASTKGINQAPESDGWIFQIEISKFDELESLLTKEQYQKFVQGNSE
jgi:glycine cleavage system H protein